MYKKKERDKANVVKCWHLGKLSEGYIGILCTILKLLCTENNAKIKHSKNKRIILLKCLKSDHTINVTQKSVSKASG